MAVVIEELVQESEKKGDKGNAGVIRERAVNRVDDGSSKGKDDGKELETEDLRRAVEQLRDQVQAQEAEKLSMKRDEGKATSTVLDENEMVTFKDKENETVPSSRELGMNTRRLPPWMMEPEEMELKYTNGDVYKGFAIVVSDDDGRNENTQRHGFGLHSCKNGDYYKGDWREDVRHGKGKMVFASGLVYEGEWANDKTWGEGVATYPNGDEYVGEWRQDHRWGWGLQKLNNGDSFEGEWVDDFMHGKGRYDYSDGGYYEGEYEKGQRLCGKYVSADESIEYSGQWKDDLRHGSGTFFQKGLYRYTGTWANDMREGQGRCIYADGSEYNGEWKDNFQNGKGEMKHPNGDRFIGYFKHGEMNGSGIALYDNGDKYSGNWKDGQRSGIGRLTLDGGDVYEGEWRSDKRHGKGQCKYKNGDKYQGLWENNKRHGYGVCRFSDGTHFRGDWEDDCWVQSAADPSRTRMFGPGLSRAVAGLETSFGIQAYDEEGNKRLSGGDEFTVMITAENGSIFWGNVADNGDGTYIVTYTATTAGPAHVHVTLGADEPVSTSPFSISIVAGVPCIKRSKLYGSGHMNAVRHQMAQSTLVLNDAYGNRCSGSVQITKVSVSLTGQHGEDIRVETEGLEDGTFKLTYTPTVMGYCRLYCYINDAALPDCPYSVKVVEAPALMSCSSKPNEEPLVDQTPVVDTISLWEQIAAKEYQADGEEDGWDSEPEEEETQEEKYAREHPDVPIVENLEDLWKVGKVQKAIRDAKRRQKEKEIANLTKMIAYNKDSKKEGNSKSSAIAIPNKVTIPSGGFD